MRSKAADCAVAIGCRGSTPAFRPGTTRRTRAGRNHPATGPAPRLDRVPRDGSGVIMPGHNQVEGIMSARMNLCQGSAFATLQPLLIERMALGREITPKRAIRSIKRYNERRNLARFIRADIIPGCLYVCCLLPSQLVGCYSSCKFFALRGSAGLSPGKRRVSASGGCYLATSFSSP